MGISVKGGKIRTLQEAAEMVKNGAVVAVGGILTAREPVAIVREIIRQGRRNLHTVGGAHSFAIDLLCAAGAVGIVENSFVGFEFDLGLALNYRRACESGLIKAKETDCNILLQQLRATEFGLPFLPMPRIAGTDILKLHPEFKHITCPFTGQELTLVPAVKPDVAIIHGHLADQKGNIKILGPTFKDRLLAATSITVIVTVEKIVSEAEMRELQPTIPYYQVSAIAEVPGGAHPTSCYPYYSYDRQHLAEYVGYSKTADTIKTYLEKYVFSPSTHQDYLAAIGGKEKMDLLSSWQKGSQQWREVFMV